MGPSASDVLANAAGAVAPRRGAPPPGFPASRSLSRAVPAALLAVALFTVGIWAAPAGPGAPLAAHAVPLASEGRAVHPHPPPLGLGRSAPRPSSGADWYTQEGATVSSYDGAGSVTGIGGLVEQLTLVKSPYPTGFELNGLSNAGDWFQLVIADNWPGCNSGFEEVTEVWSNSGSSGAISCDPTLALHAGDVVDLNLSFDPTRNACLVAWDATTGRSESSCIAPPDTGGTEFVALASTSDGNGYYTGPMTEVLNATASSCPDYARLPTVGYAFLRAPDWVSAVIPWSDEWEYGGNFTGCWGSVGGTYPTTSSSPTTSYLDTAAGTGFSSRWVGVQNMTPIVPGQTLRFETDPVPLTSVGLSTSAPESLVGSTVQLNISAFGGVGPYRALYILNSTSSLGVQPPVYRYTFRAPGTYSFLAYVVDATDSVFGPSNNATVTVPSILAVWALNSSPIPGAADVGQPIAFIANVTGGLGPRSFTWAGLPIGCVGNDAPRLNCTPTAPGWSNVTVAVRDGNGSNASSAPLPFLVSPALGVALDLATGSADVNQSVSMVAAVSGGVGPYAYRWSGLPAACGSPVTASVSCAFSTAGTFRPLAQVTDANEATVVAPSRILTVAPDPLVSVSADRTAVDAGVAIEFSAFVTGGVGPMSYSWVGLPVGCAGTMNATLTCVPGSSGAISIALTIVDQVGLEASSAVLTIPVYSVPTVTATVSASTVGVGGSVTFRAAVVGGMPGPSYQWTGLPPGCISENTADLTCIPAGSGAYVVTVQVSDLGGAHVSGSVPVDVHAATFDPVLVVDAAVVIGGLAGIVVVVVWWARRR